MGGKGIIINEFIASTMICELDECISVSFVGDNVEELFTRIATTAFESVMMKEIEASLVPSNGQIARTSTLISTLLHYNIFMLHELLHQDTIANISDYALS